mmetsp:Transcript_2338/g.4489  ORF Transcript_2338/g.4489 Transcript_2338/m.4489 type:complete len:297 (-) Transcript_2338:123-1013(-)
MEANYSAVQQRIIDLAEKNGSSPITAKVLLETLSTEGFDAQAVQVGLQELMNSRRLETKQVGDQMAWSLVSVEDSLKFKGLSQDHMLVLQEIRNRGNKGIFKKELKKATGLPQAQLTRVLKMIENRKLVKAVKTITSRNMNLYVLWDVTPSREHTGGPWYSEQEFDVEFVSRMCAFIEATIRENTNRNPEATSLIGIHEELHRRKLTTIPLTMSDLRCVLDKEIYESRIEPMAGQENRPFEHRQWKLTAPLNSQSYLRNTPCGVCPVRRDCTVGGIISPTNCTYMDPWLDEHVSEW